MPFNFKEAFEKGLANRKEFKRIAQETKRAHFDAAFTNVNDTIKQLRLEGVPEELESPVADWLEQFYEHGCVWLNEDLKRLADLWLKR